MKIAVIGSRSITSINLSEFLPPHTTEIVSGGARGTDSVARRYAKANGLKLTEFFPQYELYGRGAPIVRNRKIAEYADEVTAFWDGKSRGTKYVIDYCAKIGKPCKVYLTIP